MPMTEKQKQWQRENKDKVAKYHDAYKEKNNDKIREYSKMYNAERRKDPKVREKRNKQAREYRLAYYGMTELDYQMMLQEQDGVCAICNRPPKNYALNIDHEHQRQEKKRSPESRRVRVRGLLCHRCNRALGLFGNSPQQLILAAENFSNYIIKYYAQTMINTIGIDESLDKARGVLNYLEQFEKRKPK